MKAAVLRGSDDQHEHEGEQDADGRGEIGTLSPGLNDRIPAPGPLIKSTIGAGFVD
jgi:hypothetical protein